MCFMQRDLLEEALWSAAFSVSVRTCYSLIMSVLGLKSNIEVPEYVYRFWVWNAT